MTLQNKRGFSDWFQDWKLRLQSDPLLSILFKQRDILVYQAMLIPESHVFVGVTEGRGLKLGIRFSIHPLEGRDHGMEVYLRHVKANKDFLEILTSDEDSMPCVEWEWCIPQLDDEIVDVCAQGLAPDGGGHQGSPRMAGGKGPAAIARLPPFKPAGPLQAL